MTRWYAYRNTWGRVTDILSHQEFVEQDPEPNTERVCRWLVFIGDKSVFDEWLVARREYEQYNINPDTPGMTFGGWMQAEDVHKQKCGEAAEHMLRLNPHGFNGLGIPGENIWPPEEHP